MIIFININYFGGFKFLKSRNLRENVFVCILKNGGLI